MATIAAKNGSATWDAVAITDIRNIEITVNPGLADYGSSSVTGTGRKVGRTDKTGSFDVYMDKDSNLPFNEGDQGTLVITTDGSSELLNETCRIGEIEWSVPIEEQTGLVSCTVNWGMDASTD